MSTAETITTRIHEKADTELSVRLETVFDTFTKALRSCGCRAYYIRPKLHKNFMRSVDSTSLPPLPDYVSMEFDQLLKAAKTAAFGLIREANRTAAIDAYMKRIDELSANVEELQNEVSNIRQQ